MDLDDSPEHQTRAWTPLDRASVWIGSLGLALMLVCWIPEVWDRGYTLALAPASILCLAIAGLMAWPGRGAKRDTPGCSIGGLGCVTWVILAIVMPFVLERQHECGGRQHRSLNNIRMLAVAVQAYSLDYGETFPGWVTVRGRSYHNVWDQQIEPKLRSRDVYSNGLRGIRSPSQPAPHYRVITYGLNGLLITPPRTTFDGTCDWTANAQNPPCVLGPSSLSNPAGTILFAELATERPMGGPYDDPGVPPDIWPSAQAEPAPDSKPYRKAFRGWIDIDPRSWVETSWRPEDSYREDRWDASRGVARDFYGGGACYAFCDGHVQFMKIAKSVGIGESIGTTRITPANCWSPSNTLNMWNPQ